MAVLTLGSFLAFTAMVAGLTYWFTRGKDLGTGEGYFLAGRGLTAPLIAGSLLLTNLSAEQLVGLNGNAFSEGLSVMAWEVIAAVSMVLMAAVFLPKYLARGVATVPQYLEGSFGPKTRAVTTFLFVVADTFLTLPVVLFLGAKGLVQMLNLSGPTGLTGLDLPTALWATVIALGVVGSIYAVFGGLRAVAFSDTINGVGLLIGGLLIAYLGLHAVAERSETASNIFEAAAEMRAARPAMYESLQRESELADPSIPWPTLLSGVLLLNLFYWCTNQQIIQRTFAADSLATGQKGVLSAAAFKLVAPLVMVLPGLTALHLYGTEAATGGITDMDDVYGRLVRDVLPTWLTGFFAAVVFGAILSSFNSVLNSTATLFSLGVYKAQLKPDATDHETVVVGQIFGAVVAVAAVIGGGLLAGVEGGIFEYLQKMRGLYFIPILAATLVAFNTRRVPDWAAAAAVLGGSGIAAVKYFTPLEPVIDGVMHNFHFVACVFALLVAFLVAVRFLAPRDEPPAPAPSPVDMTPWRGTIPAGALLIAGVAGLYAAFL